MLLLNPPDHTRIRSLVSRAFTPRRVEELRPTFAGMLDPILDQLALDGGGDIMETAGRPVPVAVISEMLGVPRQGNEHIRPLVRAVTALIDPASDDETTAAGERPRSSWACTSGSVVATKSDTPDDRLLSALIQVEAEGDRLSPEELIANTILLYAAGFETTSNLIGNGLRPCSVRRISSRCCGTDPS